ncbi:glycoside hydrolase family 104 protein [Halomonas sp. HP20-15]|uniref:glycoside hydrolase family 24 protein n=1 Tax=Halomonas sp. HP20-15 TaxID=3085901 RepID=UPI002980A27E|nr:glycoside hydrolase family 104 protein [Halomonas sp. HP20-15]MDW5376824.1 glycoside hydrolase family 104 protein [Halomonas sp. HP20-15]
MSAHAPTHWLDEVELAPFDPPVDPKIDDAPNLAAFFDMLAHAEGTVRFGNQDGFNVLVGGGLFHSFDDHPRRSVWLPAYNIHSTAAGRYQFLAGTWDDLVDRFGFRDFSPASQDAGATQLIRQCKALRLIYDGRIREAIHACRTIWASLPGAGYGQREVATDELIDVYRRAGGNVA